MQKMEPEDRKVVIGFTVDPIIAQRFKALAKKRCMSRSAVIQMLLIEYMEANDND